MFLKEIQLKNYKCFEKATFQFSQPFTVIVGDNGSGKTALLDGIARGLDYIVTNLGRERSQILKNDEIRIISHKLGSKSTLEKQYPLELLFVANIENKNQEEQTEWNIINQNTHVLDNLIKYLYNERNKTESGSNNILPLIVYYKTTRHWTSEEHKDIQLFKNGSRLDPYKTALNPSTSFKILLEWFMRMEFIQFQRKANVPELQAVRQAIIQGLNSIYSDKKNITEAYFSAETNDIMVNIGDGQELPIRMLSDRYRNTLGVIADIAFRMAELNPHILNDSSGIVLIDELDLHLHPKWQKAIVPTLKKIFPNCQFIVTTHSPFIIQSLEEGELLQLEEFKQVSNGTYINQSIEDISENIQEVINPQWSQKRLKMYEAATEYYKKLQSINGNMTSEQHQKLREELDLISKPFTSEVAYIAFLEQERLVKESQL